MRRQILYYEELAELDIEERLWFAYRKSRVKLSDIAYYAHKCARLGLHETSSHYFLGLAEHFASHGEMEIARGFENRGLCELEKAVQLIN